MTTVPAPISAVVIARDAGRHLAATLASVFWCAERLVLDSGSTDDTVAIARAAGARVEHQPFLGYGPQKRRGVALATHDWILSLDADEALDARAAEAIRSLDLADPAACYALRRRTFIGRREVLHGPWGGERVLRLFHRDRADFSALPVHEQVVAASAPRLLPGSILHHSFTDPADVLARSVGYARLKAGIMRGKGQRVSGWTLPWRGAATFAKSYLLQGGWRDGTAGFVIALARVVDSTLPRSLLLLEEQAERHTAAGAAEIAPPPG
ncbi:MAG: glycosyltransferase family 2 protein [Planctomycetia bacterium]|nr:glycosyltransferase family 2 protein [Planctomycetia bacterium]